MLKLAAIITKLFNFCLLFALGFFYLSPACWAAESSPPPHKLALLLPLSGKDHDSYQEVATAIKNGFLAAYYADHAPNKPEIALYDTRQTEALEQYRRAAKEDADVIIGPLDKAAVETLSHKFFLPRPTLALNYVNTGHPPSDLYQYGLAAEDEAVQAAELLWQTGHHYIGLISEQSPWSERIARAFSTKFQDLGGQIVASQRLIPQSEQNKNIEELLNITLSRKRKAVLEQNLGIKLKFQAHVRQDLDGIFLAATPNIARQIPGILRFNYADNIPVYATSSIYPVASKSDRDLDGIIFCDIPWIVESQGSGIRHSLATLWPQQVQKLARFYAMGVDAYTIANSLAQFKQDPQYSLEGQTGLLRLNKRQQFQRHLTWAQIVNGKPIPLVAQSSLNLASLNE